MLRPFTKTLTAGVLAVTLAATGITASATPAAANGHRNNGAEAAAVFGGLLLLYGLSQAGRNNNGVTRHNPPRIHTPAPQPRNLRVAPARCFVQGRDDVGPFRGYIRHCMHSHVAARELLPNNCLRYVYLPQGHRYIYVQQCLARNGWVY